MRNKRLFTVAKILLVILLFGVIFYNINWVDSYTRLGNDETMLQSARGQILGPWDNEVVRFQTQGSTAPIDLQKGRQVDGTTITVSPGFLTYLRNLDLALFTAGAALFFVFVIIINSRWWFLMRANGLGVRFMEAQKFGWIGLFFSNVLPGATGGDVIKAVYPWRTVTAFCGQSREPARNGSLSGLCQHHVADRPWHLMLLLTVDQPWFTGATAL
jgi:hypothetical protein